MTALLVLHHASAPKNRDGIAELGLLPHTPGVDGNFPAFGDMQPRGVYLYSEDFTHVGRCGGWLRSGCEDLWEVAHFGPLIPDPIVENAVVSPEPIDRHLRLVEAAPDA